MNFLTRLETAVSPTGQVRARARAIESHFVSMAGFLLWPLLHLPLLLRAYWLLALSACSLAALPSIPILAPLQAAVLRFSRRGKLHASGASSLAASVPQSCFTHFYIAGVISTSSLLAVATLRAQAPEVSTLALLLLMEAHVLRRLYESLYISRYSIAARMHLVGYLVGISYYVAAPLSLASFLSASASLPPPDLSTGFATAWRCSSWWHWLGAAVFAWGSVHQYRCHLILAGLRAQDARGSSYSIPRGDWFELVSCAHYLAEIVIYLGLMIVSGGSDLTVWLLFGWVVANLSLSALETHAWYLRYFKQYPQTRRAIIPHLL